MNVPIKYRFEVWYQSKGMKHVSEWMSKMDLGVDGLCIQEVFTFNYTDGEKPISYYKDLFRQCFESCGCTIVKIEGGKVE